MDDLFTISRRGNVENGYIIWTQAQIRYIVEAYKKEHSIPKISRNFNVSPQAIRTVLKKEGIRLLAVSELQKLKYPRNSNFFERIDNPFKAYWLGFLYADGYISKDNAIRINLKREDEMHLKKFLTAIGCKNNRIKYSIKNTEGKEYFQAYCQIKDKKMALDLADKGCVNNKSLTLTFPPKDKLSPMLYSHFIRGYFDGDGCLTWSISGKNKRRNYKINFVGTKSFLTSLKKILKKENLALAKRGNYYSLDISGNKQITQILNFLYENSLEEICLTRKKIKYLDFLSQSISGEPIKYRV